VSLISLYLIQRFARKDTQGELIHVGAARYTGAMAIVTETVDRRAGNGFVRMGTESWRATSLTDERIPVGVEVRVIEVTGVRLVVEPRPPQP
jgi:membrane protein implicated in regulation of membrane protease activity